MSAADRNLSVGERRRRWLDESRLYFICEAHPGGREPGEVLRTALQAGVDIVQLRDKEAGEAELVQASRVFRRLCDAYDALFVVNDRPELALACAADGVHLGQGDVPVSDARRTAGDDVLIGLSTHSPEQIDAAHGCDYIGVGPVYETPTKPGAHPVGEALVRIAAERAPMPFFAIGGIDEANIDRVLAAGARRVAVVRAIRDAPEPGSAARALREHIELRAPAGAAR